MNSLPSKRRQQQQKNNEYHYRRYSIRRGVIQWNYFLSLRSLIIVMTTILLLSHIQQQHNNNKGMNNGRFFFISAFSTGAGSCPSGMNALTNITDHIDENNGQKNVNSLKQGFNRFGIDFMINGTIIEASNDTTSMASLISLQRGETYYFELIATKDDYLMKGFLIRIEYYDNNDGNKVIDMIPFRSNGSTAIASACDYPVIGLTHTDNTTKTSIGSIVTFESLGMISIDITIVFNNTNMVSNFAYESYTNIPIMKQNITNTTTTNTTTPSPTMMSNNDDLLSTTPSPIVTSISDDDNNNIDGTFPPTMTWMPTITIQPSSVARCYVCNSTERVVTRPNKTLPFLNIVTTCGDIYETGMNGYIPPNICSQAIIAVKENRCGCFKPTPVPTIPIIPTLPPIPTLTPTVPMPTTIAPTLGTSQPTYTNKCYICGDNTKRIQSSNAIVTLSNTNQIFTCEQLHNVTVSGRISPTLCETFQLANQQQNNICNCQSIPTPAPIIPVVPTFVISPSILLTPSTTLRPTISRKPTITKQPTVINPCFACGDSNQYVSSRSRVASYFGVYYTCGELYDVQHYIDVRDESCASYSSTIINQCGCYDASSSNNNNNNNNNIIAPQQAPFTTFIPTISPKPTITKSPTFTLSCPICNNINDVIFNVDETVIVLNRLYTCGEIYKGGMEYKIPPNRCPNFQLATQGKCYCISSDQYDKENNISGKLQDTSSSSSYTIYNIYNSFYDYCGTTTGSSRFTMSVGIITFLTILISYTIVMTL